MAKTYYEAHITMIGEPNYLLKSMIEEMGWKFSAIDGDPTLGDGVKCYATKHFKASEARETVLQRLHEAAYMLSNNRLNIKVIRKKIELVIYDDRSSTVRFECEGKCPECHTQAQCHDCGRPYGDEYGFPDLVVPNTIWKEDLSPTKSEGGLLCPSCMCKRAYDAGLDNIQAKFTSGPFCVSTVDQINLSIKNLEEQRWKLINASR